VAEGQRLLIVTASDVPLDDPGQADRHEQVEHPSTSSGLTPLTPIQRRLLIANAHITDSRPDRADFLHTVMCQVGLPRSKTDERVFERRNGYMSILLEAGKLYDGLRWVEQPLPYGVTPRLVMVHVSTEAIRTRCRTVEIGDSMRQFLAMLGMSTSGGQRGGYQALRKQMMSLAACSLKLGLFEEGRAITVDSKPIKRFEAWVTTGEPAVPGGHEGPQHVLWPGVMELSQEFFETLSAHAVPLDYRALAALQHSALALDIYTWLAHRLCRVAKVNGVKLSWNNLKEQFGQEYNQHRDFKRQFRAALNQVMAVYPDAKIGEVDGGLVLYPSHPPLVRTMVTMP
jgi:hypothetical protein